MKLSIIIVSYNVQYFLEQCLHSVFNSVVNFDFEVICIDNLSSDSSVKMVKEKFTKVNLIENKTNVGFAKANNQGIKLSKADYVLLLNPDTIIEENTLQKCINFLENDQSIGSLGVKMLDGKGIYLPESKRGLPTIFNAFSKLFGLSKLFPKSKIFGGYYLSYLDENKNNEVAILSGACMFVRTNILEKVGLLDEAFFMYGEDIDWCYRIQKNGFKNYYFANTSIIHFKGESTKKGNLNYVKIFYKAMSIYVNKHYNKSTATTVNFLLNFAIFFRAIITIFYTIFKNIGFLLLDIFIMISGVFCAKFLFENFIKIAEKVNYPAQLFTINMPIYIFCWLVFCWFFGVYSRQKKWYQIVNGIFFGSLLIAIIYAFLPLNIRFSRGIIVFCAWWNLCFLLLSRMLFLGFINRLKSFFTNEKYFLIVANYVNNIQIKNFFSTLDSNRKYIGYISNEFDKKQQFLGNINQMQTIAETYLPDEIIFCSTDISSNDMINIMAKCSNTIDYKITTANNDVIIGSNSKNTAGEIYTYDINFRLNNPFFIRLKRLTDIFISIFVLCLFPIFILFSTLKFKIIIESFLVLLAQKTWIGFGNKNQKIANLKNSVLDLHFLLLPNNFWIYLKEYNPLKDVKYFFKLIFK